MKIKELTQQALEITKVIKKETIKVKVISEGFLGEFKYKNIIINNIYWAQKGHHNGYYVNNYHLCEDQVKVIKD